MFSPNTIVLKSLCMSFHEFFSAPMQNKGYDWRSKSTFWLNLADIGNILESDGNVKFVREAVAQPGMPLSFHFETRSHRPATGS
jgi:hypothetical protein